MRYRLGTRRDAAKLAALHTAVADHQTSLHGKGIWSYHTSERGALHMLRTSRVIVATDGKSIVGTARLQTKKPWAIDVSYFTPCERPLYLVSMAVLPERQGEGIGRKCMKEAERVARAWPADAIRLDAFDSSAGAGGFYERAGYTERGRTRYKGSALIYYELLLTKKSAGLAAKKP